MIITAVLIPYHPVGSHQKNKKQAVPQQKEQIQKMIVTIIIIM